MLHELRIYHAMPGRLADLQRRFEMIILPMWKEWDIRAVGFWTVMIGSSNHALYYMLEWKDLAERGKLDRFRADPEWQRRREETERNGPLVHHTESILLQPTAYSSLR